MAIKKNEIVFQLSESQKKMLLEKELASFHRHCEEHGWNPEAKEKEFYEQYTNYTREVMTGALERGAKQNVLNELFQPAIELQNYWDLLHWTTENKKKLLVAEIEKVSKNLPVNYAYLSKLYHLMNVSDPSENNSKYIASLLLNIPVMNVFELDFNAFVMGRSIVANIPCICYYTLLPGIMDFFVNLFLSALIPGKREPEKFAIPLLNDDALHKNATNQEFILACMSGIVALSGNSPYGICSRSNHFLGQHPMMVPELSEALVGSSFFVGWHEYSHLLLGHIEMAHTPKLEFEADLVALKILVESAKNNKLLTWRLWGLAICLNIMEMLHTLEPAMEKTHPSPSERMAVMNEMLQHVDFLGVNNVIKKLWLPAYEKFLEMAGNKTFK